MSESPLTIWCNARLTLAALEQLKAGVGESRLVLSDKIVNNLVAGVPDPLLAEADIAFGQPDAQQVIDLPRLAWIHLSSAGYARYDRQGLRDALRQRGAVLTNSSSVFAEACAQHALGFILAQTRQLPFAFADQLQRRSWKSEEIRRRSAVLGGQTVLIVGYGSIGRRLAELLAPFRLNVIAIRRSPRGDEGIPVRKAAELPQLLGQADHVVNILPAADGTDRFFDSEMLGRFKAGAVFYNIGRGATVDQTALRSALESGHLGAAYLDVTTPEPLAADDPLWTAPNCYITPHTAGGSDDEFSRSVGHFLRNLERYRVGQSLLDKVF